MKNLKLRCFNGFFLFVIALASINWVVAEDVLSNRIENIVEKGSLLALDTSNDVEGPDVNSNGVRDDIDRFIALLPITSKQRVKMIVYAKSIQSSISIDPDTRVNPSEFAQEKAQALICLINGFEDRKQSRLYAQQIERYTANTYIRFQKYNDYNLSRNGTVLMLPSPKDCH